MTDDHLIGGGGNQDSQVNNFPAWFGMSKGEALAVSTMWLLSLSRLLI